MSILIDVTMARVCDRIISILIKSLALKHFTRLEVKGSADFRKTANPFSPIFQKSFKRVLKSVQTLFQSRLFVMV
jgi:hypothetical protein